MDIFPITCNPAKLHEMKIITRNLHIITRKKSITLETLETGFNEFMPGSAP